MEGDFAMRTTTRTFAAALILGLLALPLAAQTSASATPYDASGAYWLLHHPHALAKFLHLSASQTATLLSLANTLDQTVDPLRQARGPLCQQLATDLGASSPDPAAVGAATLALFDNRQMIAAARKSFDISFSAILTPAQLIAYDTLKQIANSVDRDFELIGDCPKS
jgi:Spy/CpxP family protein refolding chaperone